MFLIAHKMIPVQLYILLCLPILNPVSLAKFLDSNESLDYCPVRDPAYIGYIHEYELEEASGLVASRRYPGVYYSIQDTYQPSNVYALWYDGTALATFDLEGIHQDDWEDITMLEYDGVDYIYIGDIGNNDGNRCRGIDDYPDMRAIRFPEPEMWQLTGGKFVIPSYLITEMTLKNPNQPTICDAETRQDFECMMADQYTGDVYMVQKNVYHHDASIYKFTPTYFSQTIWLQEVGKMPRSSSIRLKLEESANSTNDLSTPYYEWPMAITGCDIARKGPRILVRNYPLLHMWERNIGQTVEDAIVHNEPCQTWLHDETLGESIAFCDHEEGFVTTSDGQRYAPIYYYDFYY